MYKSGTASPTRRTYEETAKGRWRDTGGSVKIVSPLVQDVLMRHLLVAGLPGAGKSTFCRWLRDMHGYIYVESDHAEGDADVASLLDSSPGWVHEAGVHILRRGSKVVLEWGFAPRQLGKVRQVIRAGFEPWWFGGDECAARRAFLDRGDVSAEAFEIQVADIKGSWARIERVFQGRVLEAVGAAPGVAYRHARPDNLLEIMNQRIAS